MRQTHYDTLGVPSDASLDDIKRAFRRLARELHPDKNPNPGATQRMQAVNAAYRVLSDRDRRVEYDGQIGITERHQEREREERERRERQEREERERQEREERERQEREERERQEREERERQEREERERQEREERERQEREERERQEREERERQEREEREQKRGARRRTWLIPAGVIGVILVAVVGTLAVAQVFGNQATVAAPQPTRIPTLPPVAALAPTATTVPTATPAPTVATTLAPTFTLVPPPTLAPQPRPPAPPAHPSSPAVNHDSVVLSWANPGDPGIIGYQILRHNMHTDAVGAFAVIRDDTGSADTIYIDETAQPGSSYVYRVKAWNAAGLSDRSDDISVTTPAAPIPTPRPTVTRTPPPTIVPTPTVNLAGWTTIPTLDQTGYQSSRQDVNLVACVAGNFEKHRRGQTVPFSDDGSYGRSVRLVAVDVLIAGAVGPQLCYKMTLKYITDTVLGFCDDDPYAGCDREGANYWERNLPLFRLLSIRDSWALPP